MKISMDIIQLTQIFLLHFIQLAQASERVTETWKNAKDGIKINLRQTIFSKLKNKTLTTYHNANIIQQTNSSTLPQCGNACQDVEQCLSFLFYRNSLNCVLVDHYVNKWDFEDSDDADYYEIKV